MSGAWARAKKLSKRAALVGAAGAAILALAWKGWIPGGQRLRMWLSAALHARQLAGFAAEAGRVPPGAVVFLGSSTISRFPFARLYPGAPCLNRGVGGDTTPGLLARLDRSLPVARPSGLVVYSGANDLRGHAEAPDAIVASTRSLLDALVARFPDVPVALIEIMPISAPPPDEPPRLRALNEGLRSLAANRGVAFVRTNRPPLMDETGRLPRSLSADGEHLNDAGYEILARWVAEDGGAATAALRSAAK
jgi:lysophospholipase L1-like esterase